MSNEGVVTITPESDVEEYAMDCWLENIVSCDEEGVREVVEISKQSDSETK